MNKETYAQLTGEDTQARMAVIDAARGLIRSDATFHRGELPMLLSGACHAMLMEKDEGARARLLAFTEIVSERMGNREGKATFNRFENRKAQDIYAGFLTVAWKVLLEEKVWCAKEKEATTDVKRKAAAEAKYRDFEARTLWAIERISPRVEKDRLKMTYRVILDCMCDRMQRENQWREKTGIRDLIRAAASRCGDDVAMAAYGACAILLAVDYKELSSMEKTLGNMATMTTYRALQDAVFQQALTLGSLLGSHSNGRAKLDEILLSRIDDTLLFCFENGNPQTRKQVADFLSYSNSTGVFRKLVELRDCGNGRSNEAGRTIKAIEKRTGISPDTFVKIPPLWQVWRLPERRDTMRTRAALRNCVRGAPA